MSDILRRIVEDKHREVEQLKQSLPLQSFRDELDPESGYDFRAALTGDDIHIIAELKRGSPSRGMLAPDFNPARLAEQYRDGGAAALSVLTEQKYFFGRYEFLQLAKRESGLPVLCKDFIFDRYQIYHAKYMKADAILLIVRLLEAETLQEFLKLARSLGLSCLVETHDSDEVHTALACGADLIGVNNRDLNDFSVRLETAEVLAPLIPDSVVKVAESGIFTHEDILRLGRSGYRAFLVGEALVTAADPVNLIKSLRGI